MGLMSTQLRIGGFLAVQFAFQPFLTRWFVSSATIKSSVVLMCELLKLFSCIIILACNGELGLMIRGERTWTPGETLWSAGPPALTYTAQNLLTQTAYQNLDGMTFNVINQTKILANAFFVFIIMGESQSLVQVLALACIFAASVLVSFGDAAAASSGATVSYEDFMLGAACCAAGSALSGLGSAVTELVLVKKQRDTLVFSAELAALSAVSLVLNLALDLNGDGALVRANGFFHAWTSETWLPVLANSLGGLAVGAVTKYAGSVRKGFAITVGLVLSAVLRVVVTGRPLTSSVALAVPLASAGIILHVKQPRRRKVEKQSQ